MEKIDEMRDSPMVVGNLEEFIDENHGIVSTVSGPEFYVPILSIVDKDQLEPNSTVLMHHKMHAVIGIMQDDADPLLNVMKVEKAPLETYADIGGLED
jgi:26S proteasome regulatory subunit T2